MSAEYPIVAITGALESGSVAIIQALNRIFYREQVKAAYIDGSAFRRYDRDGMKAATAQAKAAGRSISHFSPESNHLDKLETLFFQYGATGTGMYRHYLHNAEQARKYNQVAGTFTPWQPMISNSDLLLYRGLHGAAIAGDVDLSQYPDLSIGIAPNANLEWMNKIHHDVRNRHVKREDAQASILKNLDDYVRHITPQFMRTHINFQLIPLVDTANPFTGEAVPSDDECYLIIHVLKKYWPNFVPLLADLQGSFMSRRNTIVIPSSKMLTAIELFLIPIIQDLVKTSRELRGITEIPSDRSAGIIGMLD